MTKMGDFYTVRVTFYKEFQINLGRKVIEEGHDIGVFRYFTNALKEYDEMKEILGIMGMSEYSDITIRRGRHWSSRGVIITNDIKWRNALKKAKTTTKEWRKS